MIYTLPFLPSLNVRSSWEIDMISNGDTSSRDFPAKDSSFVSDDNLYFLRSPE